MILQTKQDAYRTYAQKKDFDNEEWLFIANI